MRNASLKLKKFKILSILSKRSMSFWYIDNEIKDKMQQQNIKTAILKDFIFYVSEWSRFEKIHPQ